MKSYLSLIPISAKIHRRQNRMTLLCIIIAVFLVTGVFSMADLSVRVQMENMLQKHGNWHIMLQNVPESEAEEVISRSEVEVSAWVDMVNRNLDEDCQAGGRKAVLYGADERWMTDLRDGVREGSWPEKDGEVLLSTSAKQVLGSKIGDPVTVATPYGTRTYTVSGFGEEDAEFHALYDTVGVYMNRSTFYELCDPSSRTPAPVCYLRFQGWINVRQTIQKYKEQYGWTGEQVDENTAVLTAKGASSTAMAGGYYQIAAVLFLMILLAGVLMISGSMNSNVIQRTKFFGMMRCIGMSKEQIIRFVRLEALNWCKTAVPVGVFLGTAASWALCAALRQLDKEFESMRLFQISPIGVASGVIVGVLTVLIAAQSPARRAASVSPVMAVLGNVGNGQTYVRSANTRHARIETALGIHHAVSVKKNLFLMTSSFAFSIILFLGFSTGIKFIRTLLPNLRSWQPDFSIVSEDGSCSVDRELAGQMRGISGVKRVFGNQCAVDIPAAVNGEAREVTLVSYDEYMFECAGENLIKGDLSAACEDGPYVLSVYNQDNDLKIGDQIRIGEEQIEVAGLLSDGVFADRMTVICSEETFCRLTGESDYAMLNVQFTGSVTEADVQALHELAGDRYLLADYRENNRGYRNTYWMFRFCVYGFMAVIALITVLNIMNSTSMSVASRIRQYGSMRAVGMEGGQLVKMIAAEVFTYVLSGSVLGCVLGLFLNRMIYLRFVTAYTGELWTVPVFDLLIILLVVLLTAIAAIYVPARRIRNMVITDTINEL